MSANKKIIKETHQSIADQTAAFLAAGGKIESVGTGVTGQEKLAGRQKTFLAKKD